MSFSSKLTSGVAKTNSGASQYSRQFEVLRQKWHEVPAGDSRITTRELIELPDDKLLTIWEDVRSKATQGSAFDVRGWYHLLYKEFFRGKKVMDVGSGLGIDGITFAQNGAQMTFIDIVESNLDVLNRLCKILNIADADFCYMDRIQSLSKLPVDYDVILCVGSLINAPFDMVRAEAQGLLKHLPVGGRWIELAYPKERWVREGELPFEKWGERTDGEGTPWVEWYDLEKTCALLEPSVFDVILHFNFDNDNYNWFDLIRRA